MLHIERKNTHVQQNEFSRETDIISDVHVHVHVYANSSFNEKSTILNSFNLNTQTSVFEAI